MEAAVGVGATHIRIVLPTAVISSFDGHDLENSLGPEAIRPHSDPWSDERWGSERDCAFGLILRRGRLELVDTGGYAACAAEEGRSVGQSFTSADASIVLMSSMTWRGWIGESSKPNRL